MRELQPKMMLGSVEELTMVILFGEEIRYLCMDAFEGSEEERRICMNVLYDMNITNNVNSSSKIANFQPKECSLNNQTGDVNVENLVHFPLQISHSSRLPYYLPANPKPHCSQSCVVESIGHSVLSSCSFDNFQILLSGFGDSCTMLSKSDYTNQKVRRDKLHVEATSRSPNSKESHVSIVVQEAFKASECADQRGKEIPEPGCVEGAVEMEIPFDVDFSNSLVVLSEKDAGDVLNCSMEDHLQTNRKCKVSYSPDLGNVLLAQNSSMNCVSPCSNSLDMQCQLSTELDVPASDNIAALVETSNAKDKTSTFVVDASLEPFDSTDLTLLLRSHACHLLEDAGWRIQSRRRRNTNEKHQRDFYYMSPEGWILRSLCKAWVACGLGLLASTPNIGHNLETERVWFHINEFWADLGNILVEVKEKIQGLEKSASLLLQWCILDPFMAVVCIDKKLTALKHGMVVKSARSEAVILSDDKCLFLASKGVEKLKDHASRRNLRNTVQPVFSDLHSRSEVTTCSSTLPHGLWGLKRKRTHMKSMHGTSHDEPSCGKNLDCPPKRLTEAFSDALDLSGRKHNLSIVPVTDVLVQEVMILDGTSKPDLLSSFEKFSIQKKGTYCYPSEKSTMDNDSFNESISDHPVLSKDTPCSSLYAAYQKDKSGSSNVFRDSIRRALPFQKSGEVEDDFYFKQKAICFNQHDHRRQELVGSFVSSCDLEVDVQQEKLPYSCQSCCLDVDHTFSLSCPPLNTKFLSQDGIIDFDSQDDHLVEKLAMQGFPEEFGCPEDGNDMPIRSELRKIDPKNETTSLKRKTLKCSMRTSELHLEKTTVKKFKNNKENEITRKSCINAKICELDETEENATSMLSDTNCICSFPYSVNHCENESPHLNHQDVINLREELFFEEKKKSLSHQKQNEESSKMEIDYSKSQKAQHHSNDFSADVYEPEVVENLLSSHCDKRCDDALNRKELDELEKANVCKNNGNRENNCYVIENNYYSISEDGVVSLEPRDGKSFGEALMRDPVNSLGAGEVKETKLCKIRRTKQHNSKIKDGSTQGADELQKMAMCKKRKNQDCCKIKNDNILDSSIIKTMNNRSFCKALSTRARNSESQAPRDQRSMRSCRLTMQTARKTGEILDNDNQEPKELRTVLYWLIKIGALSLNDILQYESPRNSAVIKEGQITKSGIVCKCCQKILSVSGFKRHAGFKAQKPSLSLFLKSGKPYISCQLQAWSTEYKLRKDDLQTRQVDEGDKNDDVCRFCADGGELICCDSCPSTYHQTCLYLQELPEGSWYCPNCSCAICNRVLHVSEDSGSITTVECSQCERRYHETCIKEGIRCDAMGSNTWFCGQNCLQVYTRLHSLIGVTNSMNDGLSWTILKCSHDDEKVHSAQKTALMAECNSKLAIALSIMEESFLPMLDPRTGNNMLPLVLYNWRSNVSHVNYQGFYTVALERHDELFSVASIRVHGVTLAEIPLIATCIEQRLMGMCRRLMLVIEETLKLLKVEMIVLSAIPDLVETWISTFGFQHINGDDKKKLCGINLLLFPGATLLKKKLYECECSELGNVYNSSSNYLPSPDHNSVDMIHLNASSEATKFSFYAPLNFHLMNNGSGNIYAGESMKNIEREHETATECANDSNMIS